MEYGSEPDRSIMFPSMGIILHPQFICKYPPDTQNALCLARCNENECHRPSRKEEEEEVNYGRSVSFHWDAHHPDEASLPNIFLRPKRHCQSKRIKSSCKKYGNRHSLRAKPIPGVDYGEMAKWEDAEYLGTWTIFGIAKKFAHEWDPPIPTKRLP